MVASTGTLTIDDLSTQSNLMDRPAANADIARYMASGERVRSLTDVVWKLCLGLIVSLAFAWAFGALPGAVRLF